MIKATKLIAELADFSQISKPNKPFFLREIFDMVTTFYFEVALRKLETSQGKKAKLVSFCLKVASKLTCK